MNNNHPPYTHFDPIEALEHILTEFDDYYFYKRTSHHKVLKTVKDYYYLHTTGLDYKEWCLAERHKCKNRNRNKPTSG